MIEVGDPLTPEQVKLFRTFAVKDFLTNDEAAALACGTDPRRKDAGNPLLSRELRSWGFDMAELDDAEFSANNIPLTPGDFQDLDTCCVFSRDALQFFFAERALRPAFLYPEAWEGKSGKTERPAQPEPEPDALPDFERMPRLLREAIRAWHDFYASGEEPPKKAELIEELLRLGYAQTKTEAEAIDKIIRPDAIKRGVRFPKSQ